MPEAENGIAEQEPETALTILDVNPVEGGVRMAFGLMEDLARRFNLAQPEKPGDALIRSCIEWIRAHQWIERRAKRYDDERRSPDDAARLAIVRSLASEARAEPQPEMTQEQRTLHESLRWVIEHRQYDRLRYLMPVALGGGDYPKHVPDLLRSQYFPAFNKTSQIVKACEWCGTDFCPTRPRRFHDPKCAATARKARQRKKGDAKRPEKKIAPAAQRKGGDALGRNAVRLDAYQEWEPVPDEPAIDEDALEAAVAGIVERYGPTQLFSMTATALEESGQSRKARLVRDFVRDLDRDKVTPRMNQQ